MAEVGEMKPGMTEQKKQAVMEQLWLHYFNQTLRDKGMISEHDYTRMRAKINSRKASSLAR